MNGRMTRSAKVNTPVRKPTKITQAATMALMVDTPLKRPNPVPTLPFSARSMAMASFSGIKKWAPSDCTNRKHSITP